MSFIFVIVYVLFVWRRICTEFLILCLYVYCHWRSINQNVGFLPVQCQDLGFQHHICRALYMFNGMRWEVVLCLVGICVFYRHSLDFILRFLKKLNCTIIYNYIYMEEKPLRYNKRKQHPEKRLGARPQTRLYLIFAIHLVLLFDKTFLHCQNFRSIT